MFALALYIVLKSPGSLISFLFYMKFHFNFLKKSSYRKVFHYIGYV